MINIVGSFPAFRPRFAGKCDRQSSDLTQFTSGYNFAVKPPTNHPRSQGFELTLEITKLSGEYRVEKIFSGENRIFFFSFTGIDLGYLSIQVEHVLH